MVWYTKPLRYSSLAMSQDVSSIAQYFSFDSAAYRHNVLTCLRAAQKSIQLTFNRNSNKLFSLYVYVLINIIRDAACLDCLFQFF